MSNDSLKDIRLIKDVIELIEKKNGPDALKKELEALGPDFDIALWNKSPNIVVSKLIELKKFNFLNFVEEVNKIGLCTRYCCTTCGSMHYRAVLRFLGKENMRKLLQNVTSEDLLKNDIHFWLHSFLILMNDMPELYFENILIVDYYRRSRNAYESKRRRAVVESEEEIQKRKEARLEQKKRNAQKHQDYIIARNQNLLEYNKLTTLNEKLLYIVADKSHHPLYFGLDFNAIKDNELKSIPSVTLNKVYKAFSSVKHKLIQEFVTRLLQFINAGMANS